MGVIMDTNSPLIEAQDAGLQSGGVTRLSHVSMAVHPGEIVCIIGPNGAGKTSLIRLLMGLEPLSSGKVVRREDLRIGYVPQKMPIDPTLPLPVHRLMTLTVRKPRASVLSALQETGVAHLIDAPVCNLSGGEFQRVLLARALLREPQLLVLDEPVQGVDFTGEAALYELIGRLRTTHGCGVLLISHDLHVVMAATDRVICLNRHVCCAGSPETVSRHPEFAQLFGGTTSQAYAVYSHHHTHGHTLSGNILSQEEPSMHQPTLKGQAECGDDHG
ncbi:MAG: ATP-binding cassette domain-containing protein [Magnetococcales bacterium]|nr:ATP-binding cassette domain-containing protein [Magnetococcales bacterium]